MGRPDPPTAIFAMSNMMMPGVLQALADLGLKVPKDVSVIGIDDFDTAPIMNPPLTVVAVPIAEVAKSAISTLLDEIATHRPPGGGREIYSPELIVRSSTRAI